GVGRAVVFGDCVRGSPDVPVVEGGGRRGRAPAHVRSVGAEPPVRGRGGVAAGEGENVRAARAAGAAGAARSRHPAAFAVLAVLAALAAPTGSAPRGNTLGSRSR